MPTVEDVDNADTIPEPVARKVKSDDVISSIKNTLDAKAKPLRRGVKLGKRRRSENESNDDCLQDLLQQDDEQPNDAKFGLSKRSKVNLAGEKWQCNFAPTMRKSSLVEPIKSSKDADL